MDDPDRTSTVDTAVALPTIEYYQYIGYCIVQLYEYGTGTGFQDCSSSRYRYRPWILMDAYKIIIIRHYN